MDPIIPYVWSLFFGVVGGILGAFFKFWIEDLRRWQRERLTKRERELMMRFKDEDGILEFRISDSRPGWTQAKYEIIGDPNAGWKFEDLGEIARLLELGQIEEIYRDANTLRRFLYRLTGKGWNYVGLPQPLPLTSPVHRV